MLHCDNWKNPLSHISSHSPSSLNLDLRNSSGETALWLALKQLDPSYLNCEDMSEYEHTFAAKLIKRGANPDAMDTRTGNCLLHQAALDSNEAAAVFLVHHSAMPNHRNVNGESPMHIAAMNGLHKLVEVLLQYGADPNIQTALKPKPFRPAPIAVPTSQVKFEDFSSSILSPSTLGALSALSVTSQATSGYSIEPSKGAGISRPSGESLSGHSEGAGPLYSYQALGPARFEELNVGLDSMTQKERSSSPSLRKTEYTGRNSLCIWQHC